MSESKETLIDQYSVLEQQIDAINRFRKSVDFSILDRKEQVLLNRQSTAMEDYLSILEQRIKLRS